MAWRKWLVRGLVFSVTAGVAAGGVAYQRWTNPASVRRQVLARLGEHLPGATLTLDSAHLRLLGGIAFTDLRLSRRDDPAAAVFLQVPAGVIYHDKEQLLHGKLAIRKIELSHPRLRLEHRADGSWNLAGLLGPVHPDEPLPTIVIRQATVLFEDHVGGTAVPPVEIQDVDLALLNDPLPTVHFSGSGTARLFGPVQASGRWQRVSGEFEASAEATAIPVGSPLVRHLAVYRAEVGTHAGQLQGTARVQAAFSHHPGAAAPWSHDVRVQLVQGKLDHPRLPQPLDQLDVKVRCLEGRVILEDLTARAGPTRVRLTGKASAPDAAADLDGHLHVEHMAVTPRLFACLPANLQDFERDYHPSGSADVDFTFRRRAGRWTRHCVIRPDNMACRCEKFPYPAERGTGTIEHDHDPDRGFEEIRVDLSGYAGGRPIRVRGKAQGEKPAAVNLEITGEDIPLDDRLMAALAPEHQKLAHTFEPRGRADVVASIRRTQGHTRFANRYVIRFHDAAVRYAAFPYPLENVSGVLDIQPDHWEFRDFRGGHQGCEVRTHGRADHTPHGDDLLVHIGGTGVLLDRELEAALQPGLKQAWQTLSPTGRVNFYVRVKKAPGVAEPDLYVEVSPVGVTLLPVFFPYPLDNVTGLVRYAAGKAELHKAQARHGPTVVRLGKGEVLLKPGGGVYVDLADLEANPLVPDPAFFQALPPALERVCMALQLQGPLALRTRLVVDTQANPAVPPVLFWDGGVALKDATLSAGVRLQHVTGTAHCRGSYQGKLEGVAGNILLDELDVFGQPLGNFHAQVLVPRDKPDVLVLEGVQANLFGGTLGGEMRIDMSPALRYELNLHANQVRLEEFGRHNLQTAQLNGLASARLYLAGEGTELAGLKGEGSLDVPSGKMYNLPLLLDLLKVLSGRLPDRTMFEEAHARFSIRGQRVYISRLDVYGNAVSLGGRGEMNLPDGSDLNLDFHAVLGRWPQVLPEPLKQLPPAISQRLLKITARGRLGKVEFHREPVPVLVDPLRELLERLASRVPFQTAD
jgi:hypothetical protein